MAQRLMPWAKASLGFVALKEESKAAELFGEIGSRYGR
jgi:hypothetical protein